MKKKERSMKENLKKIVKVQQKMLEGSAGNAEWGFEEDIENFIYLMSFLNPQSYGSRIENRIAKDCDLQKVASSEGCGDFLDKDGNYWEAKVSLVTQSNPNLNLVQIRPWQNLAGYICVAFDIRDTENFKYYMFKLSHDEMIEEMKLCNMVAAHGTKKANLDNSNIEFRGSLPVDENNENFSRWLNKYRVTMEQWDQSLDLVEDTRQLKIAF